MSGVLDWETEVRPVLEAVYAAYGEDSHPAEGVTQEMVNAELGREPKDDRTGRVLAELEHTGYVVATIGSGFGSTGPHACRLTEEGLQHTPAAWPISAAEEMHARLVAELERRIAEAPNEKERTRLQKILDGVAESGREIFTNVVSGLAEGAVRGAI